MYNRRFPGSQFFLMTQYSGASFFFSCGVLQVVVQPVPFRAHGVLDQVDVALPHIEEWLAVSPAAASVLHHRLGFLFPEQCHRNWMLNTMIQ